MPEDKREKSPRQQDRAQQRSDESQSQRTSVEQGSGEGSSQRSPPRQESGLQAQQSRVEQKSSRSQAQQNTARERQQSQEIAQWHLQPTSKQREAMGSLFQEGLTAGIFTPQRVEELRMAIEKSKQVWEKWVADTQEMVQHPQSFQTISSAAQQRILNAGLAFLKAFDVPVQQQQQAPTLSFQDQTPVQASGQQTVVLPSGEQSQPSHNSPSPSKALQSLLRHLEKAGVMSAQQCSRLPDTPGIEPREWDSFVTHMKDLMQNPHKLPKNLAPSAQRRLLRRLRDFLDAYGISQPPPKQSNISQRPLMPAQPPQQLTRAISLPKDHMKAFLSLYNETLSVKLPLDQEFRDLAIRSHEQGMGPEILPELITRLRNKIEEYGWPEFPATQTQQGKLMDKAKTLLAIYVSMAQQHQIIIPRQQVQVAGTQQQAQFELSFKALIALKSLVRYMQIIRLSPGELFETYEKGLRGGWKESLPQIVDGLRLDIAHFRKTGPANLGSPGERTKIADLMAKLLRALEEDSDDLGGPSIRRTSKTLEWGKTA